MSLWATVFCARSACAQPASQWLRSIVLALPPLTTVTATWNLSTTRAQAPGYGLYSTPRDMARYLAWQIDRPNVVVRRSHQLVRGSAQDGEALIWNVTTKDGERLLWHGGGSFGETSQVALFAEVHEGYALMANDACAGSEAALKELAIGIRNMLRNAQQPAG